MNLSRCPHLVKYLDLPVCIRFHLSHPYHILVLAWQSKSGVSINGFVQCAGIWEFTLTSESILNFGGTSILSPSLKVIKRHVNVVFGNMV